ncbi:hypothetical protein FRB94_001916 [Tulasnella sp. JGI-2019a]|nr:hypothetical protein FRB94_001916 [Tulasnella sp. JGI-2019a]
MKINTALYANWVTSIQCKLATANQKICPNLVTMKLEYVREGYDLDGTFAILAWTNLRTLSLGSEMADDEATIYQSNLITGLLDRVTNIIIYLLAADFKISSDYAIFKELRQLYIHGVVWRKGWGLISDCLSLTMLTIKRWTWLSPSMDGQMQKRDGRVDFFFPNLKLTVSAIRGGLRYEDIAST